MNRLYERKRYLEFHYRISRMAALLWAEANCPVGRDLEFWLKAEGLVRLQL